MLYHATPTADLYFLHGLRDLVSLLPGGRRRRPIWRIGPNCFFCQGRAVIIRYASLRELRRLQALKPSRCAYVIDDDLTALDEVDALPADYRHRLLRFRSEVWPRIVELCDWVVAPNSRILDAYPGRQHKLLHPAMPLPENASRPTTAETSGDGMRMVFSGTRSHLADLQIIVPALLRVLARHPSSTLTTFLGRHAPAGLQGPNIHHHRPLSWRAYKRMQRHSHFDIALIPMRDTAFNRARSINKVLDHAAFGSAGLYPDLPIFRKHVADGVDGLLLPANEDAWEQALEHLLLDTPRVCTLAANNLALARRIGDVYRQRQWWLHWLGLT